MFDLRTVPHTDADMLLAAIVHLDLISRLEKNPATTDDVCRAFDTTACSAVAFARARFRNSFPS